MHTFVLKTELFERDPWVAISLYKAFIKARDLNYRYLYDTVALTVSLPWVIDEIEKARRILAKRFGTIQWRVVDQPLRLCCNTWTSKDSSSGG